MMAGRIQQNFKDLSTDQKWGLLVLVILIDLVSICGGSMCAGEAEALMGAGLGGAIGFVVAGLLVMLLLRAGLDNQTGPRNARGRDRQ